MNLNSFIETCIVLTRSGANPYLYINSQPGQVVLGMVHAIASPPLLSLAVASLVGFYYIIHCALFIWKQIPSLIYEL